MKHTIFESPWSNDEHLKRFAKIYALVSLTLGCLFMIWGIVFYFCLVPEVNESVQPLKEIASIIASEPSEYNMPLPYANAASEVISESADLIVALPAPLSLLFFLFGLLLVSKGFLFFKVDNILNKAN